MILSGRDIQLYIQAGRLKIEPVTQAQFQQNGVDLILDKIRREHEDFYLGVTREVVTLPDDVMAFVNIRSSWARKGFSVPPTIVDAGFSGDLTLEIINNGKYDCIEPLGERFIHLIFAKTSGPCEPYNGKYQGQRGITKAI